MHPTATAAISLGALIPILAAAGVTADPRVLDPLVPALAIGAAVSNIMDVRLQGRLWVSGSFLCCLMAAAVLGPSAGACVALGSELGAWAWCRYPLAPFAVNCLGAVGPTWTAGLLLNAVKSAVGSDGLDFDVAVGLVVWLEVMLNILIVSSLMALNEKIPLLPSLATSKRLLPFLGANTVLLVAVIEAYYRVGVAAAIFLIVVMLVFTYVVRLFVDARERTNQMQELSTDRGRLVAEALSAEDRARRALAAQLHDDAIQSLLVARQDLEEARRGNRAGLVRADAAVQRTVTELRDAVFDLHPAILEHAGLAAAISAVAREKGRRAGFAAYVSVDPHASGINDPLLFSLVRELIFNVSKHAQAGRAWIRVSRYGDQVELRVRDDGRGFRDRERTEAVRAGHIGLPSSIERAEAFGGRLELTTVVGTGTDIRITLPVAQIADDSSATHEGATPATPATRDA